MFNSVIKGNQRCNAIYSVPQDVPPAAGKPTSNSKHYNSTYKIASKLDGKDVYNNSIKKFVDRQVSRASSHSTNAKTGNGSQVMKKARSNGQAFEDKITIHSIIGFNDLNAHKPNSQVEQNVKKENLKATHHETLQRIECETDEYNYYQRYWFSSSLEKSKLEDRSREERIEITRHEFVRRLQQMQRSNVGKPNKMPDWTERRHYKVITRRNTQRLKSQHKLMTLEGVVSPVVLPSKLCEVNECGKAALVCAKYCVMHIMYDSRQILFEYCTAKFADNTQCSMPVFDIAHELPLCAEHARKRDNYSRLYQDAKPKKVRRKVKQSAMIRPQKRSKKKKKPPLQTLSPTMLQTQSNHPVMDSNVINSAIVGEIRSIPITNEIVRELESTESSPVVMEEDLQIVDQVLALNENGLEQALASQAHLLEETDITNVLSTIQVDEFDDFFSVNRNGEYEPSREEAEELEKALAAVDNDVKSLEKLSQTHGLLDSFLDEHVLSESLVQIPEMMFHNGYAACGDNIVTQNNSFLLPVEPHSHS